MSVFVSIFSLTILFLYNVSPKSIQCKPSKTDGKVWVNSYDPYIQMAQMLELIRVS